MKKLAIFGLASVMALGFVACDNYEEPNPPAQSNPQDSILTTEDVSVASVLSTETYDLEALNESKTAIDVATVTVKNLAPGYSIAPVIYLSADNFAKQAGVEGTATAVNDSTFTISVEPQALQDAYYSSVSHGPAARDIELRMLVETVSGGQVAIVGGPDNYYGPFALNIKPFAPTVPIEKNYYLIGTISDWGFATAVKFTHSGLNPYDDPVFTLYVDISAEQAEAGWWWKIIPESTYETGNWVDAANASFGVADNGDEALEGMLVGRTADKDCGAGCVKEAGQFKLTIDMLESTYAFTSAVTNLYTPGDSNGWDHGNSQKLFTSDYINYQGYAKLSGIFKFTSAPDWKHTNYGLGEAAGTLSTDGGADNLSVENAGLYWCKVNTEELTYELAPVSTYGLIGDATEGGWEASTPMTTSDDLVWTVTTTLKKGNLKFRANDAWTINLGGDLNDLSQDGDNIAWDGEGTYEVTLDLSKLPYTATFVKK